MKTFQLKKNYNPWISKDTLNMMKERDRLHKIAGQHGTNENWDKYKRLRNQINNRLNYEEKQWQSLKLRECKGDSKTTQKTLKSILNWNSNGSPTKLFHNGELRTKTKEIADCQNE